ncbi:hypothetical protein [Salidesulfovibrio brasiliensis]|uniref:hypothetical protein n=1 Tax=Salidesulfovibrio brasiliensis TaxID=221711 RepID=UPI0006D1790B|nr:hypothetical protein [Salidesulfovibrio brasiliensis]
MAKPAIKFSVKPGQGGYYVCIEWSGVIIEGPLTKTEAIKLANAYTNNEIIREYHEWAQEQLALTMRDQERRYVEELEAQRVFFENLLKEHEEILQLMHEILERIRTEFDVEEEEEYIPTPDMGM